MALPTPIAKLTQSFWKESPTDRYGGNEPKLKVHIAISRLAFLYEKVRNAIDYKDEHLLRKNAIERMLKRRLYTEVKKTNLGRLLLTELIRARYLPNNTIPERVTGEIDEIIQRYVTVLLSIAPNRFTKERRDASNWLLSVLATEIEHHLVPQTREDALVEAMYKVIRQDVDLANDIADPQERDIQVYIAIHRALIKSDFGMIRYHLMNFYLPGWINGNPHVAAAFQRHFFDFYRLIERQVRHPYSEQLLRFVKRFSILFTMLRDVLEKDPGGFENLVDNKLAFEAAVRDACNAKYAKAKTKLRRSYVRTIIYVFFTKMLLALVLELPYDIFVLESTNYSPLFINIIFHPILMFLIAASIRVPSDTNTNKIVELLTRVVNEEPHEGFLYKKKKKFSRSKVVEFIFGIVYTITFAVSFGVLIWFLRMIDFNIVSGVLFVFFLTIISFFGMRLRRETKDLVIIDQKDSFISILIDFFSIPILRVGQYISAKTPKINLFLFVLDFIIEAPFKIFLEVVEDWVTYQREKKEEIV